MVSSESISWTPRISQSKTWPPKSLTSNSVSSESEDHFERAFTGLYRQSLRIKNHLITATISKRILPCLQIGKLESWNFSRRQPILRREDRFSRSSLRKVIQQTSRSAISWQRSLLKFFLTTFWRAATRTRRSSTRKFTNLWNSTVLKLSLAWWCSRNSSLTILIGCVITQITKTQSTSNGRTSSSGGVYWSGSSRSSSSLFWDAIFMPPRSRKNTLESFTTERTSGIWLCDWVPKICLNKIYRRSRKTKCDVNVRATTSHQQSWDSFLKMRHSGQSWHSTESFHTTRTQRPTRSWAQLTWCWRT